MLLLLKQPSAGLFLSRLPLLCLQGSRRSGHWLGLCRVGLSGCFAHQALGLLVITEAKGEKFLFFPCCLDCHNVCLVKMEHGMCVDNGIYNTSLFSSTSGFLPLFSKS